jgi:hypothetical protein
MEANLASSSSFKDDKDGVEALPIPVSFMALLWDCGISGGGGEEASEKGLRLRSARVARVGFDRMRVLEEYMTRRWLWLRSLEAMAEMSQGTRESGDKENRRV